MEVWSWVIFGLTTLVGLFVVLYAYGMSHLKHIKENWVQYRCSPMYMPLAGAVGSDIMTNFMHCSMNMIHNYAGFVMDPIHNNFGVIGDVMGDMQSTMNDMRGMMNSSKTGFLGVISGTFGKIQNTMSAVTDNIARMRTMMNRAIATFVILANVMDTGIKTGESVANGPIGQAASYLCFSPLTHVRTPRGMYAFYELKVGDILLDVDGKEHVIESVATFDGRNTQMFHIGTVHVSGNHKVLHEGKWIRVEDHPYARPAISVSQLMCLNTSTHVIPADSFLFRDFEETSDLGILRSFAEQVDLRYNGEITHHYRHAHADKYNKERGFHETTMVRTQDDELRFIDEISVGDLMHDGSHVIGVFKHEISQPPVEVAGVLMGAGTWYLDARKKLTYAGYGSQLGENTTPNVYYHLMTDSGQFQVVNCMGSFMTVLDDQELVDEEAHAVRDQQVCTTKEGFTD
jgi:hypothetical protein